MTIAVVGTISEDSQTGSSTTVAVTRTVGAGNALIVWTTWGDTSGTVTCADNNGGSYTASADSPADATDSQSMKAFYALNHNAGSTTVTVTFSPAKSFRGIVVLEVSGAALHAGNKGAYVSAGSGTDGISTGNITPTSQPGVLFALCFGAHDLDLATAGTGATSIDTAWPGFGGSGDAAQLSKKTISSLSAVAGTFTPSSGTHAYLVQAVILAEATTTANGATQPKPQPIRYGGRILRPDQLPQIQARRNIASPTVNAALAQTLADVTSASTATVAVAAAVSKTLDALTSTSTATVAVGAAVAKTLDALTAAATATVADAAAVAATLDPLTSAATATVAVAATLAQTLDPLASSSTAAVAVTAALAQTLDPLTSVATATGATSAALDQTLDALTSSATATVAVTASLTATLDNATLVATATGADTADVGVTLDPLTVAATATVAIAAAVSATLDALTCVATAEGDAAPAPTPSPQPSTGGGGYGYSEPRRRKGPQGRATVAYAPSLYPDRGVAVQARATLASTRSSTLAAKATAIAPIAARMQATALRTLVARATATAQVAALAARTTVASLAGKASIAHLIDTITDDELTAILVATYQPHLTQAPAPKPVPAPSIGTPTEYDPADFYALTHAAREHATRNVGRVGTLTVKAIADAVTVLGPLRDALAAAVAGASSHGEADAATARVCAQYANDPAIAEALLAPAVKADLAGRLMVHTHEAPGVKQPVEQLSAAPLLMAGADGADGGDGSYGSGDARAFLDKPWTEAIEWFRARKLASPDELSTLLRDRAAQSEEAQRLLLDTVQSRVKSMLADSLTNGGTFREFATGLRNEADGLGISADDTSYLDNVFRTNLATAYGAGRNAAQNDPDVVEAFPYREIRTAGDSRVRDGEDGGEDHVQLNGLVFRSDHPVLRNLRGPFGFLCRCQVVAKREHSGDVITELPENALHPGFGGI